MSAVASAEDETVHFLKNQLSIILGFAALLVDQIAEEDPRRGDVNEIRAAADAALSCLRALNSQLEQKQ